MASARESMALQLNGLWSSKRQKKNKNKRGNALMAKRKPHLFNNQKPKTILKTLNKIENFTIYSRSECYMK